MISYKYTITAKLLENVKRITKLATELNGQHFPDAILVELEQSARDVSAYASTSIEGNPLPLTDVKQILKQAPEHIRDTEREVLNYNRALERLKGIDRRRKDVLDEKLLLEIHQLVTDGLLPKAGCGRYRQEPVFVNDPRSGQTVYWPPDHQDVPQLMNELLSFLRDERTATDPIILAGLFHKRLALIHPFIDGNGRTVRLATTALLANMGIDTFRLFSFERFYNSDVTRYFERVGERGNYYDLDIDYTSWLEYFTDGILDELLRVSKELEKSVRSAPSGLKKHHWAILNHIDQYGTVTDAEYAKLTERAKATRALDLRFLIDQGLIERHGKGRAIYYQRKAG